MGNLDIYERTRIVPETAKKIISGGRLNGFTDINPMWRIKTLTEIYGPCGVGWYVELLDRWVERGSDDRIAAFCNINLFVKNGDEWSKPIFGTGGSMLTDVEREKLRSSDECFKSAYTDAISVACKVLGFGADVYWEKDITKYTKPQESTSATPPASGASPEEPLAPRPASPKQLEVILSYAGTKADVIAQTLEYYKVTKIEEFTSPQASSLIKRLLKPEETK